ncbi:N-6 DNA methylase [Carbonactinospora thermoautotrophica]|uniref:N-6 DNA methylase n=1 Tax=Carbonactinospora thermoautotrophica TaxID=1469144 RepID=UPI00226D9269|nr:N-6 DNA methylase [Carbonactinospora thermoautotrophica]MCX9192856.1 N-6 DNA methylase [Carbonactinospora thermoautotrophica]
MPATVTAAEIARLAGVGRAAVSNWRRRHPDFPRPVGGTATSPVFDLAEVEAWLRAQGKLRAVPAEERVWQQLRAAADDLRLGEVIGLAGAFLLYLERGAPDLAWPALAALDDATVAARLPEAVAAATADLPGTTPARLDPAHVPLVRALAELAAERGTVAAFEYLRDRYVETHSRRFFPTSPAVADLMVGLASPLAGTVFDPACGTGTLLRVALERAGGPVRLVGQELDPAVARLAAVRLALRAGDVEVRVGDSLRADAFPDLAADVVVCNPPFNERSWGQEELAYDPRWEYGLPPRTESELAWVQHALAHARPGGRVVLTIPPGVAARRAGRRIRAELLRRGALLAVVALPASLGPTPLPLHVWVLHRGTPPAGRLLMVDATGYGDDAGRRVLAAWEAFLAGAEPGDPATCRSVPVIDLLDEDVDLTPARHLAVPASPDTAERYADTRERLRALLARLPDLVPEVRAGRAEEFATSTVAELARAGVLELRQVPVRAEAGDTGGPPLLTAKDVVLGRPPSGHASRDRDGWPEVVTRPGDVVVPMVAPKLVARVVTEGGALLGPHLYLLRPDPDALDPWFLAGFLRSQANARRTATLSGSMRVDVRRARVPRLPLAEQRRYGEAFRRLADFEEALTRVAELGKDVAAAVADGLTDGTLRPPDSSSGRRGWARPPAGRRTKT